VATGQGIGFAIPINVAREIIPQLKKQGKVTRGGIGVYVQKMTPELAKSFGLEKGKGALVADVIAGGAAEKGGIRRGDIIVRFDGKEIHAMKLKLKVGELKEEAAARAEQKASVDLGMSVQEITPEMARQLRLKETGGVIVSQVESGSPADEAGLQRGDIIQEINGQSIRRLDDYRTAMGKVKKDEVVRLLVKRGERNIYLAFRSNR
jgi:serine protease Do